MLERDFQKQVINFLKEKNIYYIKVWRRWIPTCWYSRHINMFKREIYSNRIKKRKWKTNSFTETQH